MHSQTAKGDSTEELLRQALDVLRVVRGNYKAWRELWPRDQAAICSADESLEAELKRRQR